MGHMAQLPLRRPPEPIGKANEHRHGKAQKVSHDHAASGHQEAVKPEYQSADDCQHQISSRNPEHLRGADEGPDTAVQPEAQKNHNGDDAPGADGREEALQMLRPDFLEGEIVPEPQP